MSLFTFSMRKLHEDVQGAYILIPLDSDRTFNTDSYWSKLLQSLLLLGRFEYALQCLCHPHSTLLYLHRLSNIMPKMPMPFSLDLLGLPIRTLSVS